MLDREMTVEATEIEGLFLIEMKQVGDERGVVREFYRESSWRAAGLPSLGPWVQINVTETKQGAVRGLHGEAMHKLVAIAAGQAFGVYVDARRDSSSFGRVVTAELSPGHQVLVPDGVGNGFQSISEGTTQYIYCFDHEWLPGMAGAAVNPLDPSLAIQWPIPIDPADGAAISRKDAGLPPLG
jgi:dTDP-4-dehydrorhamnose 3,5-epimerase